MIWLDSETFSETPIKAGVYKYAEACEVMVITYAIDDGAVHVWDVTSGAPMPGDLEYSLFDSDEPITAHQAMFDRTVLRMCTNLHLDIPLLRWRCSMAQALAHSLPGGLEKLCVILDIEHDKRKLDIGKQLIQLFCKPRPKTSKVRRATRETHPAEWARFIEYATVDVEAMRAIVHKLPGWNYAGGELALWHLDQRVNDRGVAVDVDLARAAIRTVEREKARLAARTVTLTRGEVDATTQREALLAHLLAEYNVDLPDMQAATLERRAEDPDLPDPVRELIANRLQASSTSPAKYKTLINSVCVDGRLRGTTQFCGAGRTGRWSGRIFQPQNLMRVPKHIKAIYDEVIDAIKADSIDLIFDNSIEAMASVIRGSIIAPPGKKFAISDLSNIEGRVLAWLAGEAWKLAAFKAYDADPDDKTRDLYNIGYARSFGTTPGEVAADDKAGGSKRQVGKVQELALGYQGGVGAFVSMAAVYKLDLEKLVAEMGGAIDADLMAKAVEAWNHAVKEEAQAEQQGRLPKASTYGLSQNAYTVCHSLVQMWREANTQIRAFWYDLERAVRHAIGSPGNTFEVGHLKARRDGAWLRIRLPSGRFLCYPSPHITVENGQITYMGVNQYTKKWSRIATYGGKLAENVTQAISRDVLASALPKIEQANYEIALHVHDEVVTEIPGDAPKSVVDNLGAILRTNPSWAAGLPLAAGSYEALRYRKD